MMSAARTRFNHVDGDDRSFFISFSTESIPKRLQAWLDVAQVKTYFIIMRVSPTHAVFAPAVFLRLCLLAGLLFARLAAAAGGVVLTEIHYHPVEEPTYNADGTPVLDLTDDVYEFVEIQNTGAAVLDLAGWSLSGGVSYTFPAGTTIAAGGYRVIAKTPVLLATAYSLSASTVLGPYTGKLGNSGDTVRLRDSSGTAVDSVTYGSGFPWPASADALGAQDRFTGLSSDAYQFKGRSLQRVSVTTDSGDPANWLASPLSPGPTPGSAQAVTRAVPKPVVVAQNFAQTTDGATIVRAANTVTVNCTYSSTASLSTVQVEYFLDDINSTAETRTVVAMTDLGGGKYTVTLPAQVDRSIVRYRFKANRGDGTEVVSPRADDPQISPIGASGAREAWHGYFVTPVRTSTNAIYDVFVSTAALTQLNTNIIQSPARVTISSAAGLPRDTPYVAATAPLWDGTQAGVFASNGQLWDIQIRYHGSMYHRAAANSSFKLHFPENRPFNGQSSWFETGHGTEFMEAQKLNRLLGLPASQMRTVDWYYNSNAKITRNEQGEYGGEMLDAYHELQQQLNPGTAKEDNGDLYKVVGNRDASQNNLEGPYTRGDCAPLAANGLWTQLQRYGWTISIQSNTWKGPKPIRDLIEGMWTVRGDTPATHNFSSNATSLANTKAWFAANFDTDNLLTSMALLEWMSIWDDACHNQFFWRRASGKWVRLGWDYDGVMANTTGGIGGGYTQTIYGGEYGATNVFDGVNWWKDTFYKCYRTEFNQRLWELNNSFCDPLNLTANGLTTAATFAANRQTSVNSQLSALGTFTKPARPTNSTPATGATVLSATNLVSSAYSHPSSATHTSTKWEIRASTGTYEEPVLRTTSTTAKTSLAIPFDLLTYGQTYYWRVTYIDSASHSSVVSAETSFTWGTTSTTAGTLVLNEVLAYNRNTVQNGADYPDYIELRNNGSTTASIAGYTLTDDPLVPAKYTFPAGTTLTAGAYLIVWADKDTTAPGLHAGFGLNSDGDQILFLNGSTIIDSVTFGPQAPDLSIGRIVNGTGGWQANTPTPATANNAKTLGTTASLRVNEWMANPAYGEDWFELHNTATSPVALGGLYLSDTPATPAITQIPALSFIAAGGHTRFWADGSTAGGAHANFKLATGGESLVLTAANAATTLDTVTFGSQTKDVAQGRLPDGGATIVSFSASSASPGYTNWAPSGVVINEIIANTASPFEDAIELYNSTASAVSLGGWWLSDDLANRKKYQIPAGTTLAAGAYLTIYQAAFSAGAVPFTLSATGDEVILSAVDGSAAVTGYGALVRFGASLENTSLGRVAATGLNPSAGGAEFWTQSAHTFGQDNPANVATFRTGAGAANTSPKIGSVTINEIMYHPVDGTGAVDTTTTEFVELHNLTASAVDLSGWRLRGDTEFTFVSGTSIAAGGYALLVSFDPSNATTLAAFRTAYGLTAATPVYGPYSQNLANSTFDVELAQPATLGGNATFVNVDKVEYRDTAPWPTTPDGTGKSLQRSSETTIGNTAANWTGNTPTPGAVNLGLAAALAISSTSPLPGGVLGVAYSTTLAGTGGTAPYTWVITSGSVPGLALSTAGVLSGTPTATGASSLTVSLTDTIPATVSKTLSLTIAATPLAIGTAATLPEGAVGSAYATTLSATGGTSPYTWSVSSGTLPAGLTLNGAGVLSGTPTTPVASSFTVLVTDSAALTATRAFTHAVPVPALVVTGSATLPDAVLGAAYSQALTGTGGVAPYAWSLASGSTLPAGLALATDGTLSGTPTAPGAYSFTVRLTDAATTTTTQTITLNVAATTLTVTTTALPD
ncbi:MAG: hypothetical protein RIQ79_214, partial [Verrucomicrobiota bacterium]